MNAATPCSQRTAPGSGGASGDPTQRCADIQGSIRGTVESRALIVPARVSEMAELREHECPVASDH